MAEDEEWYKLLKEKNAIKKIIEENMHVAIKCISQAKNVNIQGRISLYYPNETLRCSTDSRQTTPDTVTPDTVDTVTPDTVKRFLRYIARVFYFHLKYLSPVEVQVMRVDLSEDCLLYTSPSPRDS